MRAGRSLLAVGLVAAMGGWPGAGARATAGPPEVFDVAAEGAPVTSEGSLPVLAPGAHAIGLARSSVTINSQPRAQSQAAIGYSPLAESLPALGAPAFPPEVQPWCYSYFPGDPAEVSCGGPVHEDGVFRAAGGSGHTTSQGDPADPRTLRSEAATVVTEVAATGVVSIATAVSMASAGAQGDRMTGRASTEIAGLTVTGALSVHSIRSRVAGTLGGDPGSGAAERELVISGAEVGGVAVTIDGEGVHAGEQSSSPVLGELQDQVNEVLASAGVAVRTVPAVEPAVAADGTSLRLSSGGLLLTFSRSEAAFSLLLGQSNLQMAASRRGQTGTPASGLDTPVTPTQMTAEASPYPAPEAGTAPDPRTPSSDLFAEAASAAPSDPQAGAGEASEQPASRLLAPPRSPTRWTIPFAPFAVLVLSLPLLAQARRLVLVPGGPR